ncbi:MAG: chloride channel protein [Pseudomonadota bacterium]
MPQLVFLGALTGVATSGVILAFRALVDGAQWQLGAADGNFEALDLASRIGLIAVGAILLAVLLQRYRPSARRVGVVHVMERLGLHQGALPLKNAVIQFFGGAIALVTGQSGGREGPAIHLGAATASLLGKAARLPNNSVRTLVACGTAAAIASSFNTPIAGVIFAMEVVMMEYTIASFLPVIIAAVSATLITIFAYGAEPAFNVAPSHMHSTLELLYLLLAGFLIGCLAAGYIQLIQAFARIRWQFWSRMLLAGTLTAGFAAFLPQIMGVGYDTVNEVMGAQLPVLLLLALLFAKAITSAASVGLGMPVGLIGPTLFMGAAVGGTFASVLISWQGADISVGFYVMLGMCAMMAAVLQAPLAALMAVLEMTGNTNLILPAMLVIAVATLVSGQLFRQSSVYITTLNTLGLQYPPNPVTLHLQRVGVTAIMERSYVRLPDEITNARAQEVIAQAPKWVLIEDELREVRALLNPADLAAFLTGRGAEEDTIRLLQIPGQRMDVTSISDQATVAQTQERMHKAQVEACCVTRTTAPMIAPVIGVVMQSHIDNYRNTA